MGNRIVATFSGREVKALGPTRWRQIQELMCPVLNVLAGTPVYFHETANGDVLALGSGPPVDEPVPPKPFTAFLIARLGHWPPPPGALPPGHPNTTWDTYMTNALVDFMDERAA